MHLLFSTPSAVLKLGSKLNQKSLCQFTNQSKEQQ